jgi:phosphoribosyl-ATP pyrophosphohydrolase/phosphoribosyl-AMP cyclohydrolase
VELRWKTHEGSAEGGGLLPVVVADRLTGEVRMVAWANAEALEATRRTGRATFFSRSRGELWEKGKTSGNGMRVARVLVDCDADTLLYEVDPEGPSCHTGAASCFFTELETGGAVERSPLLVRLEAVLHARRDAVGDKSYVKSLYDRGVGHIAEKVREEADELGRALERETDERVASEAADVLFHVMVGLVARGLSVRDVLAVLAGRFGVGGHEEKAKRPV